MRDGKEHSSLPIRAGKNPAASSGAQPAASASASATAKLRLLISSLPEESHTTLLTTKVQNGKDVLREASKRQETINNPRAFQIISKAVYCLDSFFAAVDTVCQVDPVHFGVAWAGIRIIVQVRNSPAINIGNYIYFLCSCSRTSAASMRNSFAVWKQWPSK